MSNYLLNSTPSYSVGNIWGRCDSCGEGLNALSEPAICEECQGLFHQDCLKEHTHKKTSGSGCECGVLKVYGSSATSGMHSTWCRMYSKDE